MSYRLDKILQLWKIVLTYKVGQKFKPGQRLDAQKALRSSGGECLTKKATRQDTITERWNFYITYVASKVVCQDWKAEMNLQAQLMRCLEGVRSQHKCCCQCSLTIARSEVSYTPSPT